MYLFNQFDNLLQKVKFKNAKTSLVEANVIQYGIMLIDLYLLYYIQETGFQHFGLFRFWVV